MIDTKMTYPKVVDKAIEKRKNLSYGNKKVKYIPCEIWERGNQINLWTYWQGFQLEDIDEKGVDILLVGQDWGNPEREVRVVEYIKEIQKGNKNVTYPATVSPTDRTMTEMFKELDVDITKRNPGRRIFFTNYSLGYRDGSETGGMTKSLMKEDRELFEDLVKAINPKIIICLGKLTYEMVSDEVAIGFREKLKSGVPFKASYPHNPSIPVYGVAHCGARGVSNVGGIENMAKAWKQIAKEFGGIKAK